jgi:hypothetical protein
LREETLFFAGIRAPGLPPVILVSELEKRVVFL